MAAAQRTHVVVVFGGESAEHDVSCVTAAHVLRALDPARYRVTAIGIERSGRWAVADRAMAALAAGPAAIPDRLDAEGTPTSITTLVGDARADERTVVLPLLHGPLGEDGTIQGALELAARARPPRGAAQPRWISLREGQCTPAALRHAVDELGLPMFVKPANMGSSVGITRVTAADKLRAAVDAALAYDEWVVLEESVRGREIEVAVLGNEEARASVPGEIVPSREFYDYEDKYLDGGAQLIVPARLSAEESDAVRALALVVFHTLRAEGMARVDFFYEEGGRGFLCNEVNTIPGFTPISMYPKLWQASGLTYPQLLDELIALALARHARRRRKTDR
ncbi:MAG: D-alanine--D-alanine ligase [Actinobacteria bacterium]|nr:D-alanine--D-alanine ligase [Actinomycetota bacterium]